MVYKAVQEGASGVYMGRNIFLSDTPKAMMTAITKVIHENMKPSQAFELFNDLKNQKND